ncbi:MAG: dicarboxylate/amino acid:cation symporter [Sphaerochaetaceae bacterium]|jgi:Na+/H+-dicarboxylate symporter
MNLIIWLAIFAVLLVGLVLLRRVWHLSFSLRVFIALIIGALYGLALFNFTSGELSSQVRTWISLVGNGYVDLLRMIIIPLVPTSIIAGLLNLSDTNELKKMGSRTIVIFLITATLAGILGLIIANVFNLGHGMVVGELAERQTNTITNVFSQFRAFIPSNPVKSAAEMQMVPLVAFSVFIGIAAIMAKTKKPDAVAPFAALLESFLAIVMELTKMVLRLTPYGVLGLTAYWLSSTGVGALAQLGLFIFAVVLACLIHMALVYGSMVSLFGRISPIKFYQASSPALLLAFSSRSSVGSITMTVSTMIDRLKVGSRVANFVGPLGAVMNMNACGGIYPAMVAIFASNAFGIPLSASQYVLIIVVSILASLGSAAVPMGATAFTVITLTTIGLPVEAIGLVAGVDFLVDMFRTMTNVAGDLATSVVVANSLGEFDRSAFNAQDFSKEIIAS